MAAPKKTPSLKYTAIALMPWKWEGVVAQGGSEDDFVRLAKQLGVEIYPTGAQGKACVEDGKPWLLWVQSPGDTATLAHEALHVTSGVLEQRGLRHTNESEEAYTYTMEDLMRQVFATKRWRQRLEAR